MELLNATGMQAAYTMGMAPGGRELLMVTVKGTFSIPAPGEDPELAKEQIPLVEADTVTGVPAHSTSVYEADYPLRKPRFDVLLLGSTYAPEGKRAERVQVGTVEFPIPA